MNIRVLLFLILIVFILLILLSRFYNNKIDIKQAAVIAAIGGMTDDDTKLFENENYKIEYKDIEYEINAINPLLELKREELLNKIYNHYTKTVLKHMDRKYIESRFHSAEQNLETQLARYIMHLLSYNNTVDPLIPIITNKTENDCNNLRNDLKNKLNDKQIIDKIIKEADLHKHFANAFKELKQYSKSLENKDICKVIYVENNDNQTITLTVENSEPVEMNKQLYDKIVKRRISSKESSIDNNVLIYCLVKRYQILRSFNQQLAVEDTTLLELKEKEGINFELFGSVINTVLPNYCSLFYDIEKYFGSIGSAFDTKILKGNFTINPPFDETIMENIMSKFIKEMKISKEKIYAYVWIPVWDKEGQYQLAKQCNMKFRNKDYGIYKPIEIINKSGLVKSKNILCLKDIRFFNYTAFKYVNATNMYKIIISN